MTTRVVTPPQYEPVTLAEAKEWCRYEGGNDQDLTFVRLIRAMRSYAENLTGRSFVPRTLELRLDCFPGHVINLPYPPLLSVNHVSYLDTNGELQTLAGSPSQFQVDVHSEPGRIWPLYGESWPDIRYDLNAVRIEYIAGYAGRGLIPDELKIWMEARISTLFEQREQLITGTIVNDLPRAHADGILDVLVTADRIAG